MNDNNTPNKFKEMLSKEVDNSYLEIKENVSDIEVFYNINTDTSKERLHELLKLNEFLYADKKLKTSTYERHAKLIEAHLLDFSKIDTSDWAKSTLNKSYSYVDLSSLAKLYALTLLFSLYIFYK